MTKINNISTSQISENTKTKKITAKDRWKAIGILGASTVGGIGVFLTQDCFITSENYLKKVAQAKDDFNKQVQEEVNKTIKMRKSWGETVDSEDIISIKEHAEWYLKDKLNNKLKLLKTNRARYFENGLKISAGLGLSAGTIILAVKSLKNKKKNETPNIQSDIVNKNINTNNVASTQFLNLTQRTTLDNFINHNKTKNISFTGLVDDCAGLSFAEDDEDSINFIRKLSSEESLTQDEIEISKKIARYKLNKDWPAGLNEKNQHNYSQKYAFLFGYIKPKTDKEYQEILLKQEVVVPQMPPKYYRGYNRLFNTQKWQDFNKWPEYITIAAKYERMENFINKIRLENYAKEKFQLEQETKKQIMLAYTKYKLNQDFLLDFNSKDNKSIKNAIMIEGQNKEDRINTLKWIVGKSNSNFIHIKDDNSDNETRLNQVITALENAQDFYKKSGQKSILWVDNFDNLLSNNSENKYIVADLKDILDKSGDEYKTTIIFETENSKKMNPIALQKHRVNPQVNLDMKISNNEFENLKREIMKNNIIKISNSDGYRFNYSLLKNEYVDLYLGHFGYTPNILWIDSRDNEKIQSVIENIDTIKDIPIFKNIEKIQFAEPDNLDELSNYKLINTWDKTINDEYIYQKEI